LAQQGKKIPTAERIGQLALSKTGKSVMIFLDDKKVGMVSVASMNDVLARKQPYAVIRIPKFGEPEQ